MAKRESEDAPKMVEVEAIKYHTNAGEEYQVGDTYEVAEDAVDSLAINGFALRTDRVSVAKSQAKAAAESKAKVDEPLFKKRGRKSRR